LSKLEDYSVGYNSGRQPPGRGPVPVRQEFVTGPCIIFQVKCFETFF